MYIQHRSVCALQLLLSTFLLVLMLFHRTHYAAGNPSKRVAECRTSHVPVWTSRSLQGDPSCGVSSSVSNGSPPPCEVSAGFFRLRPNGDVRLARAEHDRLGRLFMLMVRRWLIRVLPITAESLSVRASAPPTLVAVHVANAGSKGKQLHHGPASLSAHNSKRLG